MKKISVFLSLLIVALTTSFTQPLNAGLLDHGVERPIYFEYAWSGNNEELWFDFNLLEGLQFSKDYFILNINNNGQGCELICTPVDKDQFFSEEGYPLREIRMSVELYNLDDPKKLEFELISQFIYEGVVEDSFKTLHSEANKYGTLKNPALDLTQPPALFVIKDKVGEGFIVFKNSFPYSNM